MILLLVVGRVGSGPWSAETPVPRQAVQTQTAGPGAGVPSNPARKIVVIDPGHGGKDPGAVAPGGVHEKEVVLTIARCVQQLANQSGAAYEIRLTRTQDRSLPLRARYQKARKMGADLFLSLHADSYADPKVRGVSVYTLSQEALVKEAGLLAQREDKTDLLIGIDLSDATPQARAILTGLSQREMAQRSTRFAQLLWSSVARPKNIRLRAQKSADLAVLKAPDIPSVLIEMGYLSNPHDRRLLQQKYYQKSMASRIVEAIDLYFKTETQ